MKRVSHNTLKTLKALLILSSICSTKILLGVPAKPIPVGCRLILQRVYDQAHIAKESPTVIDSKSSALQRAAVPPEVDSVIQAFGPFEQPSAVQVFSDGKLGVYGTKTGVALARPDVVTMKKTVDLLTGTSEQKHFEFNIDGKKVTLEGASSVVGSARIKRSFADVDAELTLVVKYDGFKEADFHDPNSTFAKAVEQFVLKYVREGEERGMIFSEAKAGHLDHIPPEAASTKSKAIKWSKENIKNGEQKIPSEFHSKDIAFSFREGLTSHSRIKFDWFLRVEVPHEYQAKFANMTSRIVEGSVMLNLAGRNGENSAVPFVSQMTDFPELGATGGHIAVEGYADNKPLKITSLFFDHNEYEIARSVTVTAPFTPIYFLGKSVLNAARTYREQGKVFKALRILFSRLNYTNDVDAYRIEMERNGQKEKAGSFREIVASFRKIVEDPLINDLSLLLGTAKNMLKLKELGYESPADEVALVAAINKYSKEHPQELRTQIREISEHPIDLLQKAINNITWKRISEHKGLKGYIDYTLKNNQAFSNPELPPERIFISLTPSSSFLEQYENNLVQWKSQYPNLIFEHKNDLHMTIAFLGQLSMEQRHKMQAGLNEFNKTLQETDLNFEGASLQKIGRGKNDAFIALRFDPERVDPKLKAAILKLKQEAALAGVVPDRHFDSFVPHITLCSLPRELQGEKGHSDFAHFLANETAQGMDTNTVTHDVKVLYRVIDNKNEAEPVYRETKLEEAGTP